MSTPQKPQSKRAFLKRFNAAMTIPAPYLDTRPKNGWKLVSSTLTPVEPVATMSTPQITPATCPYDNDGVRITQPGAFEGEPIFAPHFWDSALEGFADRDDGRVFTFKISQSDFDHHHTLKAWLGRKRTLRLHQNDQGFIHCF